MKCSVALVALITSACAIDTAGISPGVYDILKKPPVWDELSAQERAVIASSVANALKDPNAAQFRWGPINRTGSHDGSTPGKTVFIYCGMVNGKNSYGGYTGYSPFLVAALPDNSGRILSSTFMRMGTAIQTRECPSLPRSTATSTDTARPTSRWCSNGICPVCVARVV